MSRQRFSSAAKAAFEKQGGLFSPHPSTHLLPGRQGKSKQVVSCLSLMWLGSQRPLKGQLVAAQTPFCEQPEASGPGSFAWYKRRRAWTQWVYREEAPSQVAFCRMHSCWRRGLFMHQAVCWEMDQRGWSSKFTAQNTCSALRMQRELAATPTGPPIYTSFLQSTACPGAAFCCNCSKGLWERDTVSLRKTKRKVWILAQHHPWNNAPGFSNGKQGQ